MRCWLRLFVGEASFPFTRSFRYQTLSCVALPSRTDKEPQKQHGHYSEDVDEDHHRDNDGKHDDVDNELMSPW